MKLERLAILVSLASCSSPAPNHTSDVGAPPSRAVTALVTGDIGGEHADVRGGGGLEQQVAAFRRAGGVVLDAGDRYFRAYRVSVPRRESALAFAEALADAGRHSGLGVQIVGERDLALGQETLRRLAQRSGAVLVSSNLLVAGTSTPAFARYHLLPASEGTLGVIGCSPVLTSDDPRREAYSWAGLEAAPSSPALEEAAREARAAGADFVIGLVHTGRTPTQALASGTIDAVVVSHARGEPRVEVRSGVPVVSVADRNRFYVEVSLRSGAPAVVKVRPIEAEAPGHGPTAASVARARAPGRGPIEKYVGNRTCAKECHAAAAKHWRSTAHSKAYARLVEEKQHTNRDCLPCHTTGFGRPGGPKMRQLRRFRNVGCESCHGPVPEHRADPVSERAGEVSLEVCAGCHRLQAYGKTFDLERGMRDILGPGHGQR